MMVQCRLTQMATDGNTSRGSALFESTVSSTSACTVSYASLPCWMNPFGCGTAPCWSRVLQYFLWLSGAVAADWPPPSVSSTPVRGQRQSSQPTKASKRPHLARLKLLSLASLRAGKCEKKVPRSSPESCMLGTRLHSCGHTSSPPCQRMLQ